MADPFALCHPQTSAVCWYYAKSLFDRTRIPQGIISSNFGGSFIQTWMDNATNAQCQHEIGPPTPARRGMTSAPSGGPYLPRSAPAASGGGANAADATAGGQGGPDPYAGHGALFNSMIHPFSVGPTTLTSFIWFQGEANTDQPAFYACAQPAMVTSWRRYFDNEAAFFGYVELEPSDYIPAGIADFRAAQLETNKLPNTGFAIATDVGDPLGPFGMVHPRNKSIIGDRLAAAALSISYNLPTPHLPPTYRRAVAAAVVGATLAVTVELDNVPTRLVATEDHCKTELKVPAAFCAWFSITGSDGSVLNATAAIGADGKSVVLTATAPRAGMTAAATAFGWNAWPINSVKSAEGFPLQPWREAIGGTPHRQVCKKAALVGCYNDTAWSDRRSGLVLGPYRVLPLYQPQLHDKVTFEACASVCAGLNGRMSHPAGIDAGNHCFCGNLLPGAAALRRPASECGTSACHADPTERNCGGLGRMVVYNYTCRHG